MTPESRVDNKDPDGLDSVRRELVNRFEELKRSKAEGSNEVSVGQDVASQSLANCGFSETQTSRLFFMKWLYMHGGVQS